jgi:hypothetical protein
MTKSVFTIWFVGNSVTSTKKKKGIFLSSLILLAEQYRFATIATMAEEVIC